MVYNQEHMLLQWSGHFRQGATESSTVVEEFTGSLRFAGPGLDQSDNMNTLGSLARVLQQAFSSTELRIPNQCFLDLVKWNRITTGGAYASTANTRQIVPVNVQGPSTPLYPTQVAWAMTWQTDAVRGPASRGRTFWPTAASLGADKLVSASMCQAAAVAGANLIVDLNAAARNAYVRPEWASAPPQWLQDIGWTPASTTQGSGVSAMVMSKIGSGTSRVISSVGVGGRLDIQRRRGNQIPDLRKTADVGGGA